MSADALADIARLALSSDEAPPSLAAATVVARIDLDQLISGIGFAELDGIEMPISAATAREARRRGRRDPRSARRSR